MKTIGIRRDCIIIRAVDLPSVRIHDDVIAVDDQAGLYFAMNPPAARIWELIRQPVSVEAVCRELGKEFAMEGDVCLDDVMYFLAEMRDQGLVKVC